MTETQPQLSYQNQSFLRSDNARTIRILCEFEEPAHRLNNLGVKGTILFFGSARSMDRAKYDATTSELSAQLSAARPEDRPPIEAQLQKIKKIEWMCDMIPLVESLATRLAAWACTNPCIRPSFKTPENPLGNECQHQRLVVTTGGGPGMMEAANRGAASVEGAPSMGMGVTLPFEKGLNPYVTEGLAFQFHYFFTRKFWLMYSARALILAPGGFGTFDELFEFLTLRQTKKIADVPIVMLNSKYWKSVINWQSLADFGTITQEEVDSLFFADDVESAFNYIVNRLT